MKQYHQVPQEEILDESWQVLVIGAGPAGSVAAIHLARKGYKVLLVDQAAFPRSKVCGDGLVADALKALERAGLYDAVLEKGRVFYHSAIFSPSRYNYIANGRVVTLKREILDAMLVQQAVESGVHFAHCQIKKIEFDSDKTVVCHVKGNTKHLQARMCIVATGASISLLKPLGLVKQSKPTAVAMRCYLKSDATQDKLFFSYDKSIVPGYAWIFPMSEGWYNMGCGVFYQANKNEGVNLRNNFRIFCSSFPPAREIMSRAVSKTPLKGHPIRSGLTGVIPVANGNLLAIGESIGTTFPFTGEGIGKAMESAEIAAEVVDEAFCKRNFSILSKYQFLLNEQLSPAYIGYKVAERWLSKPWLNDFVTQRMKKSEFLQNALTGIINEKVDPRTIFSVKGILRSFWS